MNIIDEKFKELASYLESKKNDIVIVNNKIYHLEELLTFQYDDLLKMLSVKPGMKLYKYCTFNKYTKKNIISNKVYLNNPLKFDDSFDSLSDVEEDLYINMRLNFYLKILNVEYDKSLSNDELIKLLTKQMFQITDTYYKFDEFLSKLSIDQISKIKFSIIYKKAQLTEYNKNGSIKKNSKYSLKKALLDEYYNFSELVAKYRISCFTTNPSNIKMWSLYANNNKGVCIEYTVNDKLDLYVLSVLYSHTRGDSNTCIVNEDSDKKESFMKILLNSVLRKDVCWLEQNEYRFIGVDKMYKDNLADFYPITGIYLGNKMSKRNRNLVIDLCNQLNVDCYYMQRDLINFELYAKKIDKS